MKLLLLLFSAPAFACNLGDMQDCTVPHGSGYQHCDNGSWSSCVVAMCDFGYYIGGIASSCEPIFPSNDANSGPPPASTTTVTVTTTSAPPAAPKSSATQTQAATSFALDGVAQRDSYCEGAVLQYMNVVSSLNKDPARAAAGLAQGDELVKRANAMGGICGKPVLDNYLAADPAKKAAAQLENDTGVKARDMAQFTHDQSELHAAGKSRDSLEILRGLLAKGGKAGKKIVSAEPSHPSAAPAVAAKKETAEPVPSDVVAGETPAGPPPATNPSLPLFPSSEAPNMPSAPVRMGSSSLAELRDLELILKTAAPREEGKALDEKLRDFTLFARISRKYRQYGNRLTYLPN